MTIRAKKFTHKGRSLEVRAAALATGWAVRLYEGNRQISPLRYNVSYVVASDARAQRFLSGDIVRDLMELMQHEVETGRLRLLPAKPN